MKPVKLNLKPKPTSRLLILVCLLGVALVAWWAWAAGPIKPNSAVSAGRRVQAQASVNGSGYTTINPAAAAGASSDNSQGSSGSAQASPVYSTPVTQPPVDLPVSSLCHPSGGGIQPDIALGCSCGRPGTANYPCCSGNPGTEIACPETY